MAPLRRLLPAAVAALAALAVPTAHGAVWAGQTGWQWGSPAPQGNTLRAVALAGTRGWAAGDFGTLLRTTDAGATWTGIRTGLSLSLTHVRLLGPDSVVVAGACALRRSDDGGRTFRALPWTGSDEECGASIASLSFATPETGHLALADGTVLRTADGGGTWQRRATVPGTRAAGGEAAPTAIWFVTPDVGVATTDGGTIARTTDGGGSWTAVATGAPPLRDVHFPVPTVGYAAGDAGAVLRTTDGGATWTPLPTGLAGAQPDLETVRCASPLACVFASADRILRTGDAGTSFTAAAAPIEAVHAVAAAAPARALAVGIGGGTALSDDAGATWTRVGGRTLGSFTGIEASSSRTAFAFGHAGALARTDDGGRTWFPLAVPTPNRIRDVAFDDARVGYALDVRGQLLRTGNGGFSWTTSRTGARGAPRAVHAIGSRIVLLAGPLGLRRSTNGGRSFAAARDPRVAGAPLDAFDPARGAVFVYDRNGRAVASSANGGRSWRAIPRLPDRRGVREYDWISRRTGFALARDGRLYSTRDGGRRWRPPAATGAAPLEGIAFASGRSGYVRVTGPLGAGVLLHTGNGGATFQPQIVQRAPLIAVAAPGGRRDFLLGNAVVNAAPGFGAANSLLWTTRRGRAGARTRIVLRARRERRGGGAVGVRVEGRLSRASGGERILISMTPDRGRSRTVETTARADGSFAVRVPLRRSWTFVAQWSGDGERQGAGSRAVTVTAR